MKKLILPFVVALIATMGSISCRTGDGALSTVETMKSQEMRNFDGALKSLMKPENRASAKQSSNSAELSEQGKDLLLPASKALILSSGMSEQQMISETNGDKGAIINLATKIYFQNYAKYQKSLKNN